MEEEQNKQIYDLWLSCHTQEEIAEETERASYSDKSGRPVKIKKVTDRTNQCFSKFDHIIEELVEHGILYKKIHHDGNVSPAKHRGGSKK